MRILDAGSGMWDSYARAHYVFHYDAVVMSSG